LKKTQEEEVEAKKDLEKRYLDRVESEKLKQEQERKINQELKAERLR
jgi:hypothetical protein